MPENTMTIAVPPERVFAVLLDPRTYDRWVVGCKRIRHVDETWPEPGSAFHHTVGVGLLEVNDSTSVVSVDRPRSLVLEARARPAGVARVAFSVEPADGGSRVTIHEEQLSAGPPVGKELFDAFLVFRNEETLRRLKELAESRTAAAE